jgi:hypothetical protein
LHFTYIRHIIDLNMIKPYWFLEDPIDEEHKYYILMDFLTKAKSKFNKKGFEKHFKEVVILRRDLDSFDQTMEFSQRTLANMTENDKNVFYNKLDRNLDSINEIVKIVKNSIETIDKFLEENKEIAIKYNSLVDVESYCDRYNLWDQGFLIVRKIDEEFMKVFSWFFSVIKIGEKEKVALLMTEMLDPQCETTTEILKIKNFLNSNIKDFSDKHDCVLVADVAKGVDIETGTEIGKEKSIDIILKNFKNA